MRWVENSSKDLLVTSRLILSYASQNNWLPSNEGARHGPKLPGRASPTVAQFSILRSFSSRVNPTLKEKHADVPPLSPPRKWGSSLYHTDSKLFFNSSSPYCYYFRGTQINGCLHRGMKAFIWEEAAFWNVLLPQTSVRCRHSFPYIWGERSPYGKNTGKLGISSILLTPHSR